MKWSLLLFVVAVYGAARALEASCPWHRTDILFFVDQKDSTGNVVMERSIKPFISSFIKSLKKDLKEQKNHNVRVGVVTFGGQLVVQHCLSEDQSEEALLKKIKEIKYAPGDMSFTTAFKKCDKADCFKPGKKEYKTDKTIVIFLTDASADKLDSAKEVHKIFKDRNYSTFGVGTGIEGRETEVLKAIADKPHIEHVFNIRDRCLYDNLSKEIVKYVRKDQCQEGSSTTEATTTTEASTTLATTTAAPQPNDKPVVEQPSKLLIAADICFIIDASFSLSTDQFNQEKKFAMDLMGFIPMGEFGARYAAITFAYNAHVHYQFDDKMSLMDVFKKMQAIPFNAEGATFTDKAVMYARTKVFSGPKFTQRHKAVKAAKIIIVITDGAPSRSSMLKTESDKARKDGITILGVGVGPGFAKNRNLLMPMVGNKKENIFIAEQFDKLNDKIAEVLDTLRKEA